MKRIGSVCALFTGCILIILFNGSNPVLAETVIDSWKNVSIPPAPETKPVTLEASTTALLLLDFNKQVCNNEKRPRCIATIPVASRLAGRSRDNGVAVIYSLTVGSSMNDLPPALAPKGQEPSVTSGPDKFLGTELESLLKKRAIKTVIVTGTAAHGAVLYTASGAALRGLKVVIPVDAISAEDLYPEQYTVWHMLNAPRVATQTTITRADMIHFVK
ncbi:MAG: cysteine hydrolase family protein [Syntrophorhabdaceae bacterium]